MKNHADTPAAGSAQLVIAAKQWDAGDEDGSIGTLRAFIDANPKHPALPSARASLASRLAQQGKADEAATLFREIADAPESRFIAPYALVALGDIDKAAGKLDDAEKSYKRVQEEFSSSPFANLAGQHLRMLRFKPPVEIEPPPVPETKPGDSIVPPGLEGAAMPKELDGNPLGAIIGSQDPAPEPAVETPPVVVPPLPPVEPPAPPVEKPATPPTEEPPAPPSDGESN